MNKDGKTFWCPVCEMYPDDIIEKYDWYKEFRSFCGRGEYEVDESDYGDSIMYCGECGEELDYKEELDVYNKFEGDRVKKETVDE